MAFDADHVRRAADLDMYVGQHHGRRDDERLGHLVLQGEGPC